MGKAGSVAPVSLMSQISFEPVPCDAKCLGCSSRQETSACCPRANVQQPSLTGGYDGAGAVSGTLARLTHLTFTPTQES